LHEAWRVEMLAGDLESAERELRRGYDLLVELGEKYLRSTLAGLLGQTLYAQGRYDEAETLAQEARELASEDDVETQAVWRAVQSKLLARRGAVEEAEALVRDAIELLEPTDAVLLKFDTYVDLAEVLQLGARGHEAREALERALELAEQKQSAVMVAAAQDLLAAATERSLAIHPPKA
jgi:tetratricopeptide (TPR) repeat protein